jgi:mannose-6-phosphate isomerase
VDLSLPYAELWVGTNPPLESYLGQQHLSEVTGSLPYLLKILSIAKPLSIQVHPNLSQAQLLHASKPHIYPDANHKPELCVALTDVELLYGLKTEADMRTVLDAVPELALLLAEETTIKGRILRLFRDEIETKRLVNQYVERTIASSDPYAQLAQLLNRDFPDDTGIFFALLMNHIVLKPGEGIFVDAGIPHAYLSGDCVEAQACSDNVARCGLTPKPKDIDTMLSVIRYELVGIPEVLRPDPSISSYLYAIPCEEFVLYRVQSGGKVPRSGPTCLLVTEGQGCLITANEQQEVRKGDSFLLTTEAEVSGNIVVFACAAGLTRQSF